MVIFLLENKVLAKNENGTTVVVTRQDFLEKNMVGHTKGMCKVLDKLTQQIVLISRDELVLNRERYEGHMKNRINVIHKKSGKRLTIDKHSYNREEYCAAGNHRLLFKCMIRNTSKKTKNINIYEYLKNPDLYDILDADKFKKICNNLEINYEDK